jgi:hypothetical protein
MFELENLHIGDRIVAESTRGIVRGNIRSIHPNGTISVTTSSGIRSIQVSDITRMVKKAT